MNSVSSKPSAKTVLRSRNASAPEKVLSTLLVRMPRPILAEFNTHRVFSRNAASTRAIPTRKLIDQVLEDPFIPLVWGMNFAGMQAVGVHDDAATCERTWLKARDAAVKSAESLLELGLHKQLVGRILEPWMWTIVCVSSTEWSNFLEQRDHPDAEPHIQILAREIRKCLEDESTIQTLQPGEWHTPFANDAASRCAAEDWAAAPYRDDGNTAGAHIDDEEIQRSLIKLSVSRCASTSYKTVDGFDMTLDRAIGLHDKLVGSQPIHASPCEHVAQADTALENPVANKECMNWRHPEEHGNFRGFRQYRHMLSDRPSDDR